MGHVASSLLAISEPFSSMSKDQVGTWTNPSPNSNQALPPTPTGWSQRRLREKLGPSPPPGGKRPLQYLWMPHRRGKGHPYPSAKGLSNKACSDRRFK